MQDQLPTHPNGEGLWQLGLCPWWLGRRIKALRHSSCESGVATKGPDACVWTSPATVPAAEEYAVIQLFSDINVVNVLVYPFAYRSRRRWRTINRRHGRIESSCLREFETTVLAICASLAGANFRVHSDCRRAKSSAMSRQHSSEEDSSRLSKMCCCCFQSVMRLRTFRPH